MTDKSSISELISSSAVFSINDNNNNYNDVSNLVEISSVLFS